MWSHSKCVEAQHLALRVPLVTEGCWRGGWKTLRPQLRHVNSISSAHLIMRWAFRQTFLPGFPWGTGSCSQCGQLRCNLSHRLLDPRSAPPLPTRPVSSQTSPGRTFSSLALSSMCYLIPILRIFLAASQCLMRGGGRLPCFYSLTSECFYFLSLSLSSLPLSCKTPVVGRILSTPLSSSLPPHPQNLWMCLLTWQRGLTDATK